MRSNTCFDNLLAVGNRGEWWVECLSSVPRDLLRYQYRNCLTVSFLPYGTSTELKMYLWKVEIHEHTKIKIGRRT